MKIKEENNKLKAEVFQLQQEVCKLKDQIKHGREPVAKHNERKITEEKYARVKSDFEKKSKDLKSATNSLNKIADYVLSRPHVPESIRKAEGEKVKLIMEAMQFQNRLLQKQEKEKLELAREKDSLQFRIGHLETERSLLKRHFDLMVPQSRLSIYTPSSSAKENLYRGGEEVSSFSRSISRGYDGRARGSIFNGTDRNAVDNEN